MPVAKKHLSVCFIFGEIALLLKEMTMNAKCCNGCKTCRVAVVQSA